MERLDVNRQAFWLLSGVFIGIFIGVFGNVWASLYFEVLIKKDSTYSLNFWVSTAFLIALIIVIVIAMVYYGIRMLRRE